MTILLLILLWAACAPLIWALFLGDWCYITGSSRGFPTGVVAFMFLFGPVGLVGAFLVTDFAKGGLRWKR